MANYTMRTREEILAIYEELILEIPTARRKLNYLRRSLKEVRETLEILRPLMREPLNRRYYQGEFVTRIEIYNLQREAGILEELIAKN